MHELFRIWSNQLSFSPDYVNYINNWLARSLEINFTIGHISLCATQHDFLIEIVETYPTVSAGQSTEK